MRSSARILRPCSSAAAGASTAPATPPSASAFIRTLSGSGCENSDWCGRRPELLRIEFQLDVTGGANQTRATGADPSQRVDAGEVRRHQICQIDLDRL